MSTGKISKNDTYLFKRIDRTYSGNGTDHIEITLDVERTDAYFLLGVTGYKTSRVQYPITAISPFADGKKIYFVIQSVDGTVIPSTESIIVTITLMYGINMNYS